ncbi:MAG: ATP-dependent helicase [Acidimicrobiia bacterium]
MRPTVEQQAITSYPLGPLRVEAGAGTGKTTTLAWRVADLVKLHNIPPQAILGITFTNKAAEELADRIHSELGLQLSQEVEVHTYHGFANQLVQEFGPLLGIERSFSVITPTFARQLLLDQVAVGSFDELDLTFPRGIVARLIKLSSELSDHLRTADDLLSASALRSEIPWPARAELATLLKRYEASKRRLDLLDYGDLIRVAHHLVADHPEVADRVRSRYQAVLCDEYQDTNPAQRELLRALFGAGFPLTVVGDPNQTIYEWRGATQENFAAFPVHFPSADGTPSDTKPLSLNRRSDRRIIKVANAVAGKIGSTSRLRPRPGAGPGHVEARWYSTALDEAHGIAEEIGRLHSEAATQWRDVAVLFRKNKDISLVRDALSDHDIPVEVANLGGLLGIPEVVELHAWLRVIRDPRDGVALTRILTGTRFRLGLGDLRPLAFWARRRDGRGDEPELDAPTHSLIEAIENVSELDIRDEARAPLEDFLRIYRGLLADAQAVSLVELCRRILDAISAWDEIEAMPDAGRLSARLNLYRFLDLAEDWSPLEGRPSLSAFLDHL